MHTSWLSAAQYANLSTEVQSAYLAPLPAFEVLSISGPDNRKYLQGQTTCDVTTLQDDNFLRGAHCDAKGKMSSIFHLLTRDDSLLVVAFRDELHASTQLWKKFGVFSKISFEQPATPFAVFGIGGKATDSLLLALGFTPPFNIGAVSQVGEQQLLKLAPDHYLLIVPVTAVEQLMSGAYTTAAPTLWLQQHIQQGLAYLEHPLIGELVPQMLNLQAVNGISFTKGCYIGQETVARLKYRGGNKRAAYILTATSERMPAAGTDIELQLNDNWRRIGQVVNAVNVNQQLWLLAVLPNDLEATAVLRLAGDEPVILSSHPLPYSLT